MNAYHPSLLLCCLPLAFGTAMYGTEWTGAGTNNNWNSGTNWSSGVPNFGSTAIFDSADPVEITLLPPSSDTILNVTLNFLSAGWTITSGVNPNPEATNPLYAFRLDQNNTHISRGAGVNRVNVRAVGSGSGPITFDVGAGNVLHWSGTMVYNGNFRFTSTDENGAGVFLYDAVWGGATPISQMVNNNNQSRVSNGTSLIYNSFHAAGTIVVDSGTLGGSGGLYLRRGGDYNFNQGAVFAPGSIEGFGDEIGTFTFILDQGEFGNTNINFNAGSSWAIQIGSQLGENDKILFDLEGMGGIHRAVIHDGVTLELFGDLIPDGTYTIASVVSGGNIVGEFETVTFNGQEINPENFTINYNGTSITIDVVGIIPEPRVYALGFGLLALMVAFASKRRRS